MNSFLKKWTLNLRKYLFTYKDGFFIFPVFTSDPEAIIYGFQHTPKVKYYSENQLAVTRTPFIDGDAYFQHIEEGLWIIYTSITYKKNICFRLIFDPEQRSKYYTLTLDTSTSANNTILSQLGKSIDSQSYYWKLLKPDAIVSNYNYQGTSSRIISLYIHQDWFEKHLLAQSAFNEEILSWFGNPAQEFILLPHSTMARRISLEKIYSQFENQDAEKINVLELKSNILALLNAFVNELNANGVNGAPLLNSRDEARILKAEQLLRASISKGFPSIAVLAKEVGLSETKLKADFKRVYGKTLFQYFSEAQMNVAEEMLKANNVSIKSVAYSLGYSHPGKFSAAFKKIKQISPSDVKTK